VREVRVALRGAQPVPYRSEPLVADVLDERVAGVDRVDARLRDVQSHHVVARLGERDAERQADVAHADDPDVHGRAV
jgi:hypothetical protein